MANNDRQQQIMDLLLLRGSASVHSLSRTLYASEATIRRDLTELERQGKLRRIFGGAVLTDLLNKEVPLVLREQENPQAKDIIAAKAAALLSDGDTIFLDASSTASHLVRHLARFQNLTVITNGPQTSLALGALHIHNLCTGGELLPNSLAYVGEHTCDFFRRFNPDVVFFSCRGITPEGMLCDSSLEESHVRQAMLSGRGKKVFLCDESKFGKVYRYNLCPIDRVHAFFSELDATPYDHLIKSL